MSISALVTTPSIEAIADEVAISVSAPSVEIEVGNPTIEISVETAHTEISTGTPIVRDTGDIPIYHGAYEVTPSLETQTLHTQGDYLAADIIINPIPNNYGLITWNGSTLMVS